MKSFNVSGGSANRAVSHFKFVPVFLLVLLTLSFTTSASAAELVINGGFEEPNLANFATTARAFDQGWTTFYGQNKSDLDPCSSHVGAPGDPFNPVTNWEVECNGDLKIPGWSVYWTDSVLLGSPEAGRVELQNNILPLWVNPVFAQLNLDNGWGPLDPEYRSLISLAKFGEQKAELDSHDRINLLTGKPFSDSNITLGQTLETCPNQAYVLTYHWKSRTTKVGDNDVRVLVGPTIVRTHSLTGDWVQETVHFTSDGSGATDLAFMSIGTGSTLGMSLDGVSVIGPAPDLLGNCPPPPSCEDDESSDDPSCTDDGYADVNEDGLHNDDDHHVDGQPIGCACEDDGSSSDDSSSDGSSSDGSSSDGSSSDGSSSDGSSSDGSSSDGSSSDGSSSDGSSSDGSSSDDGSSDDGSSDDGTCGICSGKGKFDTLTILYDGDNLTSHNQDADKASVVPETVPAGLPVAAYIRVIGKARKNQPAPITSIGTVLKGQTFVIVDPENAVTIEIFDGDTLVQTVEFHASCSQPLEQLDSFGGITIWDGSKDD